MAPTDVHAGQLHGVVILNAAAVDGVVGIEVRVNEAQQLRLHAISIRPEQIVPDHHGLGHRSAELVLAERQHASVHKGLGVRVGAEDRSAAHPAQHFGVAAIRQLWCLFATGSVRAREHGEVPADALRLEGDANARLSGNDVLAILKRVQTARSTVRHGRSGGHA
jgi:hypothetical protein